MSNDDTEAVDPGEKSLGLAAIRSVVGEPTLPVRRKVIDRIDDHCRAFIARSPFLCIATADARGDVDVSPRGDRPGFVQVLDERTLAIPDRPGNRLVYSYTNLSENSGLGLIFFIPGMPEVLRVNGTAVVVEEPRLLETMAVDGKVPRLAVKVSVMRAHLHCGRAALRASLWSPDGWPDTASLPSTSQMLKDHVRMDDLGVEKIDAISTSLYQELY